MIRMSRQMLLEHQGMSPASSTAQRSIRAQHSKTRAGELQPRGVNGKNKLARMISNIMGEGHPPATYRDKLRSFRVFKLQWR